MYFQDNSELSIVISKSIRIGRHYFLKYLTGEKNKKMSKGLCTNMSFVLKVTECFGFLGFQKGR